MLLFLHCSWFFFQNFQLFAKSFLYGIDSSALLLSYLMIADANLTTFLFSSYEYLMRRQQQAQEMQPQRVVDLVKRLEESLFKTASSKVYCCFSFAYYNIVMLYKMVLSWKVISIHFANEASSFFMFLGGVSGSIDSGKPITCPD